MMGITGAVGSVINGIESMRFQSHLGCVPGVEGRPFEYPYRGPARQK